MKLSDEERVNIVQQILDGQSTAYRSARELGVSESYIKHLVSKAKQHGIVSLLHSRKNKSYSAQEKYNMVQYAETRSLEQASTHFDVPLSSIKTWKDILEEEGFEGLAARKKGRPRKNTAKAPSNVNKTESANKDLQLENEKLKKELEQARMENDFLKKLDALVRERIKRESSNSYKSSKN